MFSSHVISCGQNLPESGLDKRYFISGNPTFHTINV